ncbi:MAG: amidohydrolase family protein [Saprospiraceae bacterium]
MHEAGMPAEEAIYSATFTSSELLGQSDMLSTIEKGKYADIIAVDGDPATEHQAMKRIAFVMKRWGGL